MHLLRFAKQKMLNNLWSLYLKGFFIYLLIDLIFIVTFVLQNKHTRNENRRELLAGET